MGKSRINWRSGSLGSKIWGRLSFWFGGLVLPLCTQRLVNSISIRFNKITFLGAVVKQRSTLLWCIFWYTFFKCIPTGIHTLYTKDSPLRNVLPTLRSDLEVMQENGEATPLTTPRARRAELIWCMILPVPRHQSLTGICFPGKKWGKVRSNKRWHSSQEVDIYIYHFKDWAVCFSSWFQQRYGDCSLFFV